MKILLAPDSFKNALSSLEVAKSLKKGLITNSKVEVVIQQLSDGGEGALDLILENSKFKKETIAVTDPIGESSNASYAINLSDKTAFIEIAHAAGLELISKKEQNPFTATTYGVGELILDAYKKGVRNFSLSLGGSATNDGGVGILSALGIQFIGVEKEIVSNSDLKNITKINIVNLKIKDCKFKILVDVNNPLLGENGATQIYARQKGAREEDLQLLENNLSHFAKIITETTNTDYANIEGCGAAGGIAFGLKSFFDAEIVSGITDMMDFCDLEQQVKNSDLVISGEGSLDSQSQNGKLLSGIAKMCYQNKKPFIFVAGKVEDVDMEYFFNKGCIGIIPIQDKNQTLEKSIERTSEMLEQVGVTIAELFV